MAEIVPDNTMPPRGKGRAAKYPWDEWADGQTRKITQGEDYTCKTNSMAVQIRQRASDRGLSSQVIVLGPVDKPNAIQFRMINRQEEAA